jgi:hypothetical protein
LVLLAVNHRRAELGPAGGVATVRLELPAVPEANRSTRAPGAGGFAAPLATIPSPPPPLPAMPQPGAAQPGAPQAGVQAPPPGSRPSPAVSR